MTTIDYEEVKKSIMWKYIGQIKDLLSNHNYVSKVREIFKNMDIKNLSEVIFVSHGSSYNVSVIASHWIREFGGLKSRCFTPMGFNYYFNSSDQYNRAETLIIAISQTGTSRGTIEAIENAKGLGYKVLTITDILDTPVANLGNYYLNIGCGEEHSNAKTKGVCCTLVLLEIFAMELALLRSNISIEKYKAIKEEMDSSFEEIDDIINNTESWIENSDFGMNIKDICFLGYGKNYGTILEGMLKLIETMCIPATSSEIAEFSHGLHRYISKDSHLIIVNTGGIGGNEAIRTYDYFKTRIDHCLLINASESIINDDNVINIPRGKFTESVLSILIIFHILSVAIPEKNGLDPNADANDGYTKFINTRVE